MNCVNFKVSNLDCLNSYSSSSIKVNSLNTFKLLLIVSSLIFSNLRVCSQSRNFYDYYAPNGKQSLGLSFNFVDPGFVCLPINGGVFISGLDTWLIEPRESSIISGFYNDYFTNSFVYCVVSENNSIVKRFDESSINNSEKLVIIDKGIYSVEGYGKNKYLIWGFNESNWTVNEISNNEVKNIITSESPITDISVINNSSFLFSKGSSVYLHSSGTHKKLLQLDTLIEGVEYVELNEGPLLFISTPQGILRFFSLDGDDFEVFDNDIHGMLKVFQKSLYVWWKQENTIVEIKL